MSEEKEIDENELRLLSAMTQGQETQPEEPVIPQDYEAHAGQPLPEKEKKASQEDIVEALKTVFDTVIILGSNNGSINIYDLGLVYDVRQSDNGDVEIDMTLTAPGCPVAGVLPQQAADVVALVEGVGQVTVKIVWEPAWSFDRMTEEARAMMEMI